jgi:hypothetical protein
MSVTSRKQTDELCKIIVEENNPHWEAIAKSKGYYIGDCRAAIGKAQRSRITGVEEKMTDAEEYFVANIQQALGKIERSLFSSAMNNDKTFPERALAAHNPADYDLQTRRDIKKDIDMYFVVLEDICNDKTKQDLSPPEIYELLCRSIDELKGSDLALQIIEQLKINRQQND